MPTCDRLFCIQFQNSSSLSVPLQSNDGIFDLDWMININISVNKLLGGGKGEVETKVNCPKTFDRLFDNAGLT